MYVIVILISAIILSAAGFFFGNLIRKHKPTTLHPEQRDLLLELKRELAQQQIKFFISGDSPLVPQKLSLNEIAELNESDTELASEEYEESDIFFTSQLQILEINKYLKNGVLPREVADELSAFYNTRFEATVPERKYYLTILEPSFQNDSNAINTQLYKGNGLAYESWLSLQEHSQNLTFLVKQALKDN